MVGLELCIDSIRQGRWITTAVPRVGRLNYSRFLPFLRLEMLSEHGRAFSTKMISITFPTVHRVHSVMDKSLT